MKQTEEHLIESVLEVFAREPQRHFKAKELARRLHVPPAKYTAFRNLLKSLAQAGKLLKLPKNQFRHAQQVSTVMGTLHVKSQGYAFLIVGEDQADVFISQRNMATALNGDLVRVQLFARPTGKKPEGRVIEIVKRGRKNLVGVLQKAGHFYYVRPDDVKMLHDIYIAEENLNGAKHGQKVVTIIESWEDEQQNPEGRIVKVLGFPGEVGVDVMSVAFSFDLPVAFPEEVERDAATLEFHMTPELVAQREDLRGWLTFTIDPEDAKDFDDAVSLTTLENGNFELGVHIADVSHFVREGTALDKEALSRSTSIYLVDRVVPMLPERLSNDLCSLKPYVDRLTYSCIMEVTPRGKVVRHRIGETIINSKKRFNYEEAQEVLEGKRTTSLELDATLREMNALAQVLTKRRLRNGSMDFDTPEIKVILDETGAPIEIRKKLRQNTNRLIEEFMLLANQTVAEHIEQIKLKRELPPFIYRIHEPPDPLKMKDFALFVKALGFKFDHQQQVTGKMLSVFLKEIKGQPEAEMVEKVLLRSMMKAKYMTENRGHFGLAFKHYSHFTSPIRRYPDLIGHRILKEYAKGVRPELFDLFERKLGRAAQQASEREITAMEAERASIKMKQVEFMSKFLGEEFDGIVSGVVAFGIFVEISQLLVEGLVHISDLADDYYIFEEKLHRLKGQNSGRVYRLGDPVRIRVAKVNANERLLDFILVERPRPQSTKAHTTKAFRPEKQSQAKTSRKKRRSR